MSFGPPTNSTRISRSVHLRLKSNSWYKISYHMKSHLADGCSRLVRESAIVGESVVAISSRYPISFTKVYPVVTSNPSLVDGILQWKWASEKRWRYWFRNLSDEMKLALGCLSQISTFYELESHWSVASMPLYFRVRVFKRMRYQSLI